MSNTNNESKKDLIKFELYVAELNGKILALTNIVKELIDHDPEYAYNCLEITKIQLKDQTAWKEKSYQAVANDDNHLQITQNFIKSYEKTMEEFARFSEYVLSQKKHLAEDDDQPSVIFSHIEQ